MTVNITINNRRRNLGDRILKALGKERLPIMPGVDISKAYQEMGYSAHIAANCEWEGFWRCLCRRRRKKRKE